MAERTFRKGEVDGSIPVRRHQLQKIVNQMIEARRVYNARTLMSGIFKPMDSGKPKADVTESNSP